MIENSIIQTAEITKVFIADNVTEIISALNEGRINPLTLQIQRRVIESIIKQIAPTLDGLARKEAESYGAKTFEAMGAEIQLAEHGIKYDYSGCNDTIYNELNAEKEILDAKIKKRESLLKAIEGSEQFYREETSETWTAYPPVKKSTSGINVTIK